MSNNRTVRSHVQSDQPDVSMKRAPLASDFSNVEIAFDNIDHSLRINNGPIVRFHTKEYLLIMLLWDLKHQAHVSYNDIAQCIYACEIDDDLLHTIRRRISTVRSKVQKYGIDIVNVPHRGYTVGRLDDIVIPYRKQRKRSRKTPP